MLLVEPNPFREQAINGKVDSLKSYFKISDEGTETANKVASIGLWISAIGAALTVVSFFLLPPAAVILGAITITTIALTILLPRYVKRRCDNEEKIKKIDDSLIGKCKPETKIGEKTLKEWREEDLSREYSDFIEKAIPLIAELEQCREAIGYLQTNLNDGLVPKILENKFINDHIDSRFFTDDNKQEVLETMMNNWTSEFPLENMENFRKAVIQLAHDHFNECKK